MSIAGVPDGKDESPAVGMAASPGIPVLIGNAMKAIVLAGQTLESGIDRLFFRSDQANLYLAFGEGENLRSEHGRICNTNELEALLIGVIAGDDEKPRTVRGPMDVGRLNLSVYLLFLFG